MNTPPLVLIADDDVTILGMVSRHLQSTGHRVIEANDGRAALALAQKERPDLIVLDVMMPNMTGWEVCKALREDDRFAETKILMLTGIGDRLNELTSPLYGADDHLDKPFEFETLKAKVAALLNG